MAIAVAIAVAATSLGNGFAYDDLPLIVDNARVTTLHPLWEYLGQSYWPAGGLYRPLTVWLLALQWKLGDGTPWIFHATNVALHALVTGLVYAARAENTGAGVGRSRRAALCRAPGARRGGGQRRRRLGAPLHGTRAGGRPGGDTWGE